MVVVVVVVVVAVVVVLVIVEVMVNATTDVEIRMMQNAERRTNATERATTTRAGYIKRLTDDAHSLPELAITSPQCVCQWQRQRLQGRLTRAGRSAEVLLKKQNRIECYQLKKHPVIPAHWN